MSHISWKAYLVGIGLLGLSLPLDSSAQLAPYPPVPASFMQDSARLPDVRPSESAVELLYRVNAVERTRFLQYHNQVRRLRFHLLDILPFIQADSVETLDLQQLAARTQHANLLMDQLEGRLSEDQEHYYSYKLCHKTLAHLNKLIPYWQEVQRTSPPYRTHLQNVVEDDTVMRLHILGARQALISLSRQQSLHERLDDAITP